MYLIGQSWNIGELYNEVTRKSGEKLKCLTTVNENYIQTDVRFSGFGFHAHIRWQCRLVL